LKEDGRERKEFMARQLTNYDVKSKVEKEIEGRPRMP
jgi:hypothetical protein